MKMSSFLHAQDGNTSRSAAAPSTATPTTNTITTTTTLAGGSLCANQCSRRLSSVLTERRQLQKNLSSWTPRMFRKILHLQLTETLVFGIKLSPAILLERCSTSRTRRPVQIPLLDSHPIDLHHLAFTRKGSFGDATNSTPVTSHCHVKNEVEVLIKGPHS